jgi:hypothetical protein
MGCGFDDCVYRHFFTFTVVYNDSQIELLLNDVCMKNESLKLKYPSGGWRSGSYYCQTVMGLSMWGALSDERTGLSFARVTVSSNESVVSMYNLIYYHIYVYITYTMPPPVQAQYSRSCPIISSSCYNSGLSFERFYAWPPRSLSLLQFEPLKSPHGSLHRPAHIHGNPCKCSVVTKTFLWKRWLLSNGDATVACVTSGMCLLKCWSTDGHNPSQYILLFLQCVLHIPPYSFSLILSPYYHYCSGVGVVQSLQRLGMN